MAWVDAGRVTEGEQHIGDRCQQRRVVTTGEIGAPNRAGKQRVTHKQVGRRLTVGAVGDGEAHTARAMARRVMRPDLEITDRESFVGAVVVIDG